MYWTSYGRNKVLLIGRGVVYRKAEEKDLCWSATVKMGVLFIRSQSVGLEQRNCVIVVFMERQRNASCSWGGNEMRRVHQEATERVGANRLGQNKRWKRGLAYCRTEETALCSTGHVRNGILFIGRVWRTAKRRKRTCVGPPTIETGSC